MTELCEIMNECGSDKGKNHHNYTQFYFDLFKNIKNDELNIFELGLGTNYTDTPSNMGSNGIPGASLRGWKLFFKKSNIYGADIDKRILFTENRIKTFFCDQTDIESIKQLWSQKEINNIQFDIIIEDGLHEFYANLIFLENSIHKLKKGGVYIVEDLTNKTIFEFEKILNNLSDKYTDCVFEIKKIQNPYNVNDNNLLIIKKI